MREAYQRSQQVILAHRWRLLVCDPLVARSRATSSATIASARNSSLIDGYRRAMSLPLILIIVLVVLVVLFFARGRL